MQHPVEIVGQFGKFVNRTIHEHGDYLFMAWTLLSIVMVSWILGRRRPPKPTASRSDLVAKADETKPIVSVLRQSTCSQDPPESEIPKGNDHDSDCFSA